MWPAPPTNGKLTTRHTPKLPACARSWPPAQACARSCAPMTTRTCERVWRESAGLVCSACVRLFSRFSARARVQKQESPMDIVDRDVCRVGRSTRTVLARGCFPLPLNSEVYTESKRTFLRVGRYAQLLFRTGRPPQSLRRDPPRSQEEGRGPC